MGIPPWKWRWGRPWPTPLAHRPCRTNWASPFRVFLACPGLSPPSRELGHPRDFQGWQTPAVRQAPTLHFGGIRPLPNRTTATITSCTAHAVTMASYGGVSTSTSLGRPISSPGIAQNNQVHNSGAGLYPKGYSCPTPRGLAKSPWTRPLTGSFQGASPQLWSNTLLQLWNRTLVRSVGSLDRVPWTLVISLQQLRSDVMARYPGYQVEPSEPALTKPISLGLANFQQAKPEKKANLPLSPSLEAWLTCQAQTLEGKDRHGRVIKPPLGQKTYPKLPSLKAEWFEPSNAPSLLRVGQLPPEWHRLVSEQGRITPETGQFHYGGVSANFNLQFWRFSPSSQIWIGGLPGCQPSPKIFSLTYFVTRISSLLELILRDTCSSPAVNWRNSRYRWRPSSLTLNWERGTVISLDLMLMCPRPREKTWELAHLMGNIFLTRSWCPRRGTGYREMSPWLPVHVPYYHKYTFMYWL